MLILGIETSCDETAAAIVEDGVRVRSNVIASSRKTFESLAGVIPEQAARLQVECMVPVLQKALDDAGMTMKDIDAIAVTRGPGLLGSLLVGTVTARTLASVHGKPLIGVHHTFGHLSSTWPDGGLVITANDTAADALFPILTLSVSGGHTDIWHRTSHTHGRLLGRTRDDAAGEAFDKGASMLGLPYPGGPSVQRAAEGGNVDAFEFPLPLRGEDTLDFSFSGLKTSLKYLLRDLGFVVGEADREPARRLGNLAASFEHAICTHLVDGVRRALDRHPDVHEVHIVGGVSANTHLRTLTAELCSARKVRARVPSTLGFCTDNAAMIASGGFFLHQETGVDAYQQFETAASVPLENVVRT